MSYFLDRQRQTYTDEDAPPTTSINDIPNEIRFDQSPRHFQPQVRTIAIEFPDTKFNTTL
jgi:hypothetical protein